MTQAYEACGEVGERCADQEAQRANEERFRSLVQRASDLTVVTDESGVIGYVSPAAEALFGYRPEDLLGLPLLNQVEAGERAERRAGDGVPRRASGAGAHHRAALAHPGWPGAVGRGRVPEPGRGS